MEIEDEGEWQPEVQPCDCCDGKIIDEGITHHFHETPDGFPGYWDMVELALKARLLMPKFPGDDWRDQSLRDQTGIVLSQDGFGARLAVGKVVPVDEDHGKLVRLGVIGREYAYLSTGQVQTLTHRMEQTMGEWCDTLAALIELSCELDAGLLVTDEDLVF